MKRAFGAQKQMFSANKIIYSSMLYPINQLDKKEKIAEVLLSKDQDTAEANLEDYSLKKQQVYIYNGKEEA